MLEEKEYLEWFIKEYGKRESKKPMHELIDTTKSSQKRRLSSERLALDCDIWDEQYQNPISKWAYKNYLKITKKLD